MILLMFGVAEENLPQVSGRTAMINARVLRHDWQERGLEM
jgi:hypothetical protein